MSNTLNLVSEDSYTEKMDEQNELLKTIADNGTTKIDAMTDRIAAVETVAASNGENIAALQTATSANATDIAAEVAARKNADNSLGQRIGVAETNITNLKTEVQKLSDSSITRDEVQSMIDEALGVIENGTY